MDDLELVAQYRGCDGEAFNQLYRRHAAKTVNLIRSAGEYKLASEDVRDIHQETWLKIAKIKTASHPPQQNAAKWISAVAVNTTLDWLRKYFAKLQHTFSILLSDMEEEEQSRHQIMDEQPSAELAKHIENRDLAERLLSVLTQKERIVYIWYHAHELKQREIAELLSLPIGTVGSLLSRAEKKLSSSKVDKSKPKQD